MPRPTQSGLRRPWGAIAALSLLLIASTQYSFALFVRTSANATALKLAPGDARVLAQAARATAESLQPSADERATARKQARAALLREPGNVAAAGALGLLAAVDGQERLARGFFDYSALRSRRDLPTQLWLIENAVAHGSVASALQHYDIALRTSKRAPELLFPVLSSAIETPQIRAGLMHIFQTDPLWKDAFEGYLARQTTAFPATTALFAMMARNGTPASRTSENILLSNMVTAGDVDEAWRYYQLRYPRSVRSQPRNATFSPQESDGSPFDWGLINENGISSSLGSDAAGGALSFAVTPGISGTVTQQLVRLPAGRYRLAGQSRAIRTEATGFVKWEVACSDGRVLGRADLARANSEVARFATDLTVPTTNCTSQLLRLVVLPNDEIEGVSGEMLDVRLQREALQ